MSGCKIAAVAQASTRGPWRVLVALVLLLLVSCRRPDGETATDLDGHAVDPLATTANVVVLVFVGTQCPISNRYAPELTRIRDAFAARGVQMSLVYPSPNDEADRIRAHARSHGLTMPVLRDPHHALVRRAEATTTPEAAVFRNGKLVYVGRIDDRQVDFGVTRPEPRRRDLELALEAALAGQPIATARTTPIGCSIPN
jgi:hypothetical protein